tara:strand:- start:2746 stop:4575 length:1830 start_codon:yes stop_codon:yes gene_type:complete
MWKGEISLNSDKKFKLKIIKITIAITISFFILIFAYVAQYLLLENVTRKLDANNFIYTHIKEIEKLHLDHEANFRGYLIDKNKKFKSLANSTKEKRRAIFQEISNTFQYKKNKNNDVDQIEESFKKWDKYTNRILTKQSLIDSNKDNIVNKSTKFSKEIHQKISTYLTSLDQTISADREKYEKTLRYSSVGLVILTVIVLLVLTLYLIKLMIELVYEFTSLLHKNNENLEKMERANAAKDLFLSNMSHELRTPLGIVLGYVNLLLEEELPKEESKARSYLSLVKSNSDYLLSLIDDLFDISKLEVNKLKVSISKIETDQLISEIKDNFSPMLHENAITLNVNKESSFPRYFFSDKTRFKQILFNLVSNAIKFSNSQDEVKVLFSLKDEKILVDILDSGIGVPAEKHEEIFEAFKQSDNSLKRSHGGAGLGLAISKKLSEIMDGDLKLLRSEYKKGSHFQFSIPYISKYDVDSIEEKSRMISSDDASFYWPDKKILIVEDSKENQRLLKIYLENTKIQHDFAENGLEAVNTIKENPNKYDLIYMDIQMPVMDGYEALAHIKNSECKTKIVALTAHVFEGEREKCLSLGFDDYLTKPIAKEKFLTNLESYL